MVWRLVSHVATRDLSQFVIHQWHQLLERTLVSATPFLEQLSDLGYRGLRHTNPMSRRVIFSAEDYHRSRVLASLRRAPLTDRRLAIPNDSAAHCSFSP